MLDNEDSRYYHQRATLDKSGILDFEYSGNMVRARFWTKYNSAGVRFQIYSSRWHSNVEAAVSEAYGELKADLMMRCGVTV